MPAWCDFIINNKYNKSHNKCVSMVLVYAHAAFRILGKIPVVVPELLRAKQLLRITWAALSVMTD